MSDGGDRRGRLELVALAAAVALGAALLAPVLVASPLGDDHLQRAMVDGAFPAHRSWLDLYTFVDARRGELPSLLADGTMPWWVDPSLEIAHFRPLASALIAVEQRLRLPDLARHLHGLAWWGAAVALAYAFWRRLGGARVAACAAALFALAPAHVVPVAWVANRTSLESTALALAGMVAHARWRQDGWKRGAWLSALGTSAALAAGEYGLCMLPYALFAELSLPAKDRRDRLRGIVVLLAPAAVYLGIHVALGYGSRETAFYLDPLREPAEIASAAPVRFTALLAGAMLALPPEAFGGAPELGAAGVALLAAAAFPFALAAWLMKRGAPSPERRVVAIAAPGLVLSTLPMLPTFPMQRLGVAPAFGATALVAALALAALAREGRGLWRLGAALVAPFVVVHALGAPATTWSSALAARALAEGVGRAQVGGDADLAIDGREVLVLGPGVGFFSLIDPPYARRERGATVPRAWRPLLATTGGAIVARTSDDTLELTATSADLIERTQARMLRASRPFRTGDVVQAGSARFEVLEAGTWGPRRLAVRLDRSLDAPDVALVLATPSGLWRVPMLAVGAAAPLPDALTMAAWWKEGPPAMPPVSPP